MHVNQTSCNILQTTLQSHVVTITADALHTFINLKLHIIIHTHTVSVAILSMC